MTKRTKVVLVVVVATLALLGVGGYLLYRNQTAESDAARQRQLERIVPTDGSAIHPSAKASNPVGAGKPDDPEANRLLDNLEQELSIYEIAVTEYLKNRLGNMSGLATSQGKLLPLVQSVREVGNRFSPRQSERLRTINDRIQVAAGKLADKPVSPAVKK